MGRKIGSRLLALALALALALGMMPLNIWGAETAPEATETTPSAETAPQETDPPADGEEGLPTLAAISFRCFRKETDVVMTPAFASDILEYALQIPDSHEKETLTVNYTPGENCDGLRILYYYYDSMFGNMVSSNGAPQVNPKATMFQVWVSNASDGMTKYTMNYAFFPVLKSLAVDGAMTPAFEEERYAYHVYADSTADGIDITPTAALGDTTLTVNGQEAVSGQPFHLTYDWDEAGKMTVPIVLANAQEGRNTTYTLTLEKEPLEDAPFIITQPMRADYIQYHTQGKTDEPEPLTVKASANGPLSYQWYQSDAGDGENAKPIDGATQAQYTPDISQVGTIWYFCRVTNTGKNTYTDTQIVDVVVDPEPTITVKITNDIPTLPENDGNNYQYVDENHKVGYVYQVGAEAETLKTAYESDVPGGTWSFQWRYYHAKVPTNPNWGLNVPREVEDTYTPGTTEKDVYPMGCWYRMDARYTFKGKTYTGTSAWVYVYVVAEKAAVPTIQTQPKGRGYLLGASPVALTIAAKKEDNGTLTYQWYSNDQNSTQDGTPIEGATKNSFLPPAQETSQTVYYYCVVTNTLQNKTAQAVSALAEIRWMSPEEAGDSWGGSGTEADPFQLKTGEDFDKLNDLVSNTGVAFEGRYFKLMNDVTLNQGWTGIGGGSTSGDGANLKPFSGILDGDGHTLTIPYNHPALFQYTRDATVENLNIYGEYIYTSGLVGNYVVDYGADGNYNSGCPATITVKNVTIKSGTVIRGSGFLGGYASGANTVTIDGCTVEAGVKIGYDAVMEAPAGASKIGSFGGDFNGTITNSTSAATVYGVSYVGGLVGAKGQTMGDYAVRNSAFTGTIIATGQFVGGIAGGGYGGTRWGVASAPLTTCATVENCYVSADITGGTNVGGILGGEEGVENSAGRSYVRSNLFYGTLTATQEEGVAGGIIGYLNSINEKQEIKDNYYLAACGADRGVGLIRPEGILVDTDPVGSGAEKLAKAMTAEQMADGTVTNLLNQAAGSYHNWIQGEKHPLHSEKPVVYQLTVSGDYKTEYRLGEALDLSGAVFTALWSDGKEETLTWKDVTVEGFDSGKRGNQTLTASYQNASTTLSVTVLLPDGEIEITFSLLGDTKHDSTQTHSFTGGGLTVWVPEAVRKADANDTVLDVLEQVLAENGMTCSNPTGTYVESVTKDGMTLAEFDNGPNSGWMFAVNGLHGTLSIADQYLEDGDTVVFHYTDDYNQEWSADAANQAAANAVEALIDAIPQPVTLESQAAIEAARAAYDALSDLQKRLVKNYAVLTAAEKALAELQKTAEDQAAADAVEALIDAIGEPVTLESWEAMEAARKAYDALTELQKYLVENYDRLLAAENAYAFLAGTHRDLESIFTTTGDFLAGLVTDPGVAQTGGDWTVLGLARAGYPAAEKWFEAYAQNVAAYVQAHGDAQNRLHPSRSTDNARVILALTAAGFDPRNVAGRDLVAALGEMAYLNKQGLNGPIWALIALDAGDYAPSGEVTREALVETILARQLADGGWNLSASATASDVDLTAMALTALAKYVPTNPQVQAAVEKALVWLSAQQDPDGGFTSGLAVTGAWTPNSQSAAQVIIALTALGIDPHGDLRFVKNGRSVVDALSDYYVSGGGFRNTAAGERDGMASEQGYLALTAYYRYRAGKNPLYRMGDAPKAQSPVPGEAPKTGDGFPAALTVSLLALSLAGMTLLAKKKKSLF